MAPLRVITGRLQYQSEYEIPKSGEFARWPVWRIESSDGQDVSLENVQALPVMRSHALVGTDATYVFTNDAWPILIGMRYEDGHIADGWAEWKAKRMGSVYAFWIGLLMIVPIILFANNDWSKTAGFWSLGSAILGALLLAIGVFGGLTNLMSKKPTKEQVAAALR
ncbi:MAG: hypothetical protein OJJ21_22125 [Ferrovibrio sp.]|uniref:hypothetical protein n=1 Tax=Ferrovibrio sp. TaxID=1917215 RepID=UPI002630B14B|nr:hypothetical protein [Ferrovibrio sp.]MCW0236311.1 hypothetical protein [Ferrovibrio sp.]